MKTCKSSKGISPAVTPKTAVQAAVPAKLVVIDRLGTYPGGKSGTGTYQTIINLQPPHRVFISALLGHCGIMRNKRPAERQVILEALFAVDQLTSILPVLTSPSADGVTVPK